MARYANNSEVRIGDKVIIRGTVTGISTSEDYHNCTVEVDELLPPESTKVELTILNTKQIEKAEPEAPKTDKKAVK